MTNSPESDLVPRSLPGRCRLFLALLAALAAPLAGCAAGPQSVASTGYVLMPADQRTINALPAPRLSAVDLSGACHNTSLSFENERARTRWPAPGYIMPLQNWAMYHAGSRAATSSPRCADHDLGVKLWQSAIGSPITGQMSERDVTEFVRIVDANDSRYANAARQSKMSKDEIAVDMFRSLAERGDAKAQFRLGAVYEQQGNWVEAERWYRKAAAQGLKIAQEKLGQPFDGGINSGLTGENETRPVVHNRPGSKQSSAPNKGSIPTKVRDAT